MNDVTPSFGSNAKSPPSLSPSKDCFTATLSGLNQNIGTNDTENDPTLTPQRKRRLFSAGNEIRNPLDCPLRDASPQSIRGVVDEDEDKARDKRSRDNQKDPTTNHTGSNSIQLIQVQGGRGARRNSSGGGRNMNNP